MLVLGLNNSPHDICQNNPYVQPQALTDEDDIYTLAMLGKVKKLKLLLSQNSVDIDAQDENGWSALFYAASNQNDNVVSLLLDHNANPYFVDNDYYNIIDIAKISDKHTTTSRLLKQRIGFTKETLRQFYQNVKVHLAQQLVKALELKKKLFIFLGETHGDYKIYQTEKEIITAAKELGIDTFYSEQAENEPVLDPIDLFAQNKQHMQVIGIDNFPDGTDKHMYERNQIMSARIKQKGVAAIARVGSDHLHGLMHEEDTQIDPELFHIVAFNLSGLVFDDEVDSMESIYSHEDPSIIQVRECIDTQTHKPYPECNI